MSAVVARPAPTRRWWKCGSCGRTLGEIVGDRVIVKVADVWLSFRIVPETNQLCPRCGRMCDLEAS